MGGAVPKRSHCGHGFARENNGMVKVFSVCAALAGAMLTTSCSAPQIDIATHRAGSKIVIVLSQKWGLFSRAKAPCVRSLTLFKGDAGTGAPVWQIDADGDVQCTDDVGNVILGETPKGFSPTVPLLPANGGLYTLVVSGIGHGTTQLVLP